MKKLSFIIFIVVFSYVTSYTQSCLPDSIAFTTQSEIDNFQTNYPNCTEIEGDVLIRGTDITNLNELNVLTSIMGYLYIGNFNGGNPSLTSLTGLDNVTVIGGALCIYDNASLASLSGLDNVTSIGGKLEIAGNDALTSLTGLDNLTSIGGDLIIGLDYPYTITGNPSLTSIIGLANVISIGGSLEISNNNALTNLTGLGNITPIGGNVKIWSNKTLTSLTGLDNLTSIGGWLVIDENDAMTSLTGLDNLTSIGDGFDFYENDVLTNLAGLDNLTTIGGVFIISQNDALTNLAGLDNLTSIGGEFFSIYYNAALTDLTGLDNLTSIGGHLAISDNDALTKGAIAIVYNDILTSLSGLDNIAAASMDSLLIYDNIALTTCEVLSVCNYLAIPGGTVAIHDNAIGCNSPEEVQDSCEANAVSIDEQYIKDNLELFPNPAHQELNISVEGYIIQDVRIYNLAGQQMIVVSPVSNKVDISSLQPGMYIVEVTVENTKVRQKLLVQR